MIVEEDFLKAVKNIITKASLDLPEDVVSALKTAYEIEQTPTAKAVLNSILNNIQLAKKLRKPICQDTGLPFFIVEIGRRFNDCKIDYENILTRAVKESTIEIPLRPNCVNPLTDLNTGDNTGRHAPIIFYNFNNTDSLTITYFPKGAGSENQTSLYMLTPSSSLKYIKKIILKHVVKKAGLSCPPIIVGVGLGGAADTALLLAKKALLRPLGSKNEDTSLAELETELLDLINKTGIGPMGLGGDTTALAVHIDYACRHTASLPLAISIQCWAARKAQLVINKTGDYKII
ncbi:MAG: fumarate hydratase [Candidatus Odinarchaeum yellowstonii]|uniref:Fumarate hydratase n=1 Tax=Odinarchaeota yellowstonii (strain LCB_4) TaxID=1841599 RepID=A0AAF0D340_ODILC|nr:MAG: fumarate hydratase [Candidatus Odinarchaeum yellowstonii]